ncbi:MAG: TIGR03960 family B12-binding radical SAM protein [Thermodesulfobacteriota bacterium]|nr:TIGR03960 family B12-binding radical SAM protein [Thermodesulfobacteriota bacterium]
MLREILPLVTKPTRYLGNEINAVHKDLEKVELKFALAFPDVYEIGMSYVGFQILYGILNRKNEIACERVYAPWIDMEKIMREKEIPLTSLESCLPLRDFDVIGFTLPYELCYTNILNMLDLAGIPSFAKERNESMPLVIAGGSCAYNPEPMAEFFDAIVIGDGEEVILEICDCVTEWKNGGGKKIELYNNLSKIQGVYIPSFFDIKYHEDGRIQEIIPLKEGYSNIQKRIVSDLNQAACPTGFIVPFMDIIHNRLSLEITRGCTRGCRFCQAGMTYRPVRERSSNIIKNIIEKGIEKTGYEDISLLSLNTGDYSHIDTLLMELMCAYSHQNISVSLPSLRPETLVPRVIDEIKKVRKTGITIAPEAGTQRLRDVINKGVTEEEILNTAKNVFAAGWDSIKLYFMIGLPTETDEDMEGIVDLSRKILSSGKGPKSPRNVTVSISTFVPKPQIPFQWESQIGLTDIMEKHDFFKEKIRGKRFTLKWQDPRFSILEGIFSQGDRRLSKVLVNAHKYGSRLDAWSEHFKYDLWKRAFADARIDMDFYNRRKRSYDEILPWDHLDCLVSKDFLMKEHQKGLKGELTHDCRIEACTECGVCNDKNIQTILSDTSPRIQQPFHIEKRSGIEKYRRFRFQYSKLDDARFLSHLELIRVFSRALRRANIPVRHSKGFHPLPRIIFGSALAVGVESLAEYIDIEIEGDMRPNDIKESLNKQIPKGIRILHGWGIPLKSSPISDNMRKINYLVSANGQALDVPLNEGALQNAIQSFLGKESFPVIQKKKKGTKKVDLRSIIDDLKLKDNLTIEFNLQFGMANKIKPFDMVKGILNLNEKEVKLLRILRIEEGVGNNHQCLQS